MGIDDGGVSRALIESLGERHLEEQSGQWLANHPLSPEPRAVLLEIPVGPTGDTRSKARAEISKRIRNELLASNLADVNPNPILRQRQIEGTLAGALGLLDLCEYKEPLETKLLLHLQEQWRSLQDADGSWASTANASRIDRARLTAGSVALLSLIRRELIRAQNESAAVDIACETAIRRGLAWLDSCDPADLIHLEVLPNLRSAAVATGRYRFGRIDWFWEGMAFLKRVQNDDGSFGKANDPTTRLYETACGLHFLARAR